MVGRVGRVNAEAKRSVEGAGAKGEGGGFRRRCGPCAFAKGLWILEDREER